MVDGERHGVHAGLRHWLLEYLRGKAPRRCVHVGGERVGGKGDIVNDGRDVGMKREEWVDSDRAIGERERGIVVLRRGLGAG